MRSPRTLLPILAALPVLAVLLALGTWQWQRLGWKQAMLADIARAEAGPPLPLGGPLPPYAKVRVTGRFDHAREVLLGAEVRGGRMGAHLLTPLLPPVGSGGEAILVDRGWVPVEGEPAIERPAGEVTVEGYLRAPDASGLFTPAPNFERRRVFALDTAILCPALVSGPCHPMGLVALAPTAAPAALPQAARTLPRPNNPHLGYAITWFGLAAALIGVLAVFLARRRTEPA